MITTCTPYKGKFSTVQQAELLNLLWEFLKHEKGYDRVYTGWGTKTQTGLLGCIERITLEGGKGVT